MSTGQVFAEVEVFQYLGGSGTFDGISTFDQSTGTLYFVNDFADSYIFGAKIQYPYALRAPIFLEDNGVVALAFDRTRQRILATDIIKAANLKRLVIFPTVPYLETSVITLPSDITLGPGAHDDKNQIYFNVGTAIGQTNSVLTLVNITSKQVTKTVQLKCGPFQKLWHDPDAPIFQSRLYGVTDVFGKPANISYSITEIDVESGDCKVRLFRENEAINFLLEHQSSNV